MGSFIVVLLVAVELIFLNIFLVNRNLLVKTKKFRVAMGSKKFQQLYCARKKNREMMSA